jgi:type 1 glutamine amidotransferase
MPMIWVLVMLVWVLPACSTFQSDGRQSEPQNIRRVLIVTGEDYPGHDWRQTTPVLKASLEEDPRLQVEILDDLEALGGKDLTPYAALILHFKNYDPEIPGRAGFDNLVHFEERGGGLVLVHFACGAFEEFSDDYERLVGRVWFGPTPPPGEHQHDPHGRFTVTMTDENHPVTRGLQPFETVDELYTCLTGNTPIVVLADAVSKRNGKTYPIAFVLEDDRSRVFHCVLGHDPDALSHEPVAELYRHATAWAAGLSSAPEGSPARKVHAKQRPAKPRATED